MYICSFFGPFVLPSACIIAAATRGISVKFDVGDFTKNCREYPSLVKNVHKYRTLKLLCVTAG